MKNLKKLTRENLKNVVAGNAQPGDPWKLCPPGRIQCEAWGACVLPIICEKNK